jgi:hypothetical protein
MLKQLLFLPAITLATRGIAPGPVPPPCPCYAASAAEDDELESMGHVIEPLPPFVDEKELQELRAV